MSGQNSRSVPVGMVSAEAQDIKKEPGIWVVVEVEVVVELDVVLVVEVAEVEVVEVNVV